MKAHMKNLNILKLLLIVLFGLGVSNAFGQYVWKKGETVLKAGQSMLMQNGQYTFGLQTDGVAVLRQNDNPRWATPTVNSGGHQLIFQGDGNLVLTNLLNMPIWASHTENAGDIFKFQDDGNLVIYDKNDKPLWASNTATTQVVNPFNPAFYTTNTQVNTRVVKTIFPTDGPVVIDEDVVLDFNADLTGKRDATQAIKNALSACQAHGGGTVWMPSGKYRVTSTITVPSSCTLRGDWNDIDSQTHVDQESEYGTLIVADFRAGDVAQYLFDVKDNAGILGVTVYYANQRIKNPIPYNYAILCSGYTSVTLKNITFINAYKGVTSYNEAHEIYTFANIKGTFLSNGFFSTFGSDVSTWEDIELDGKYWANAPQSFNPPQLNDIENYTKTNATGIILGDVEWDQFLRIRIVGYRKGIQTQTGVRSNVHFVASFIQLTIRNSLIGIQIDDYDTRWGVPFVNCVIKADQVAVINNVPDDRTRLRFNHSVIEDPAIKTDANFFATAKFSMVKDVASKPPLSHKKILSKIPQIQSFNLFNAAKEPFNAPRVLSNQLGMLPTVDATPKIQKALNLAGSQGGGVVFLPAGFYKISGVLVVPSNVELRGASAVSDKNSNGGTTLFVHNGYNSQQPEAENALITLHGKQAGVSGIKFFHPARNFADAPNAYSSINIPFPFVVRGIGSDQYVKNVTLQNSYLGIDFSSKIGSNYYIERLVGSSGSKYIVAGGGADVHGEVKNINFNPNSIVRASYGVHNWLLEKNLFDKIMEVTRQNAILLTVEGREKVFAHSITISNVFAYGVFIGISNDLPDTVAYNIGTDNLGAGGYTVSASQHITVLNLLRYNGAGGTLGIGQNGYIQLYNQQWLN